jgi:mannosidase alpha-like ER degradation enhancer 2
MHRHSSRLSSRFGTLPRTTSTLAVIALTVSGFVACDRARTPTAELVPAPLDAEVLAQQVREEFVHAWQGYTTYAWGHDDLLPLSREGRDWHDQTLYMTPVDALDTMMLMGLDDETERTRNFLAEHLSFNHDMVVKNFEITIRVLGGLLSAYQLSGDQRLLDLAEDLGKRLLPVFDSPTGMPYMYVNLASGATSQAESNPAEIGTLLLEFGTLGRLTGNPEFYNRAKRALVELFERRSATTGLVGSRINVETGNWIDTSSHMGGGIDSYYEYLLKASLLFDDRECGAMYRRSIAAANAHLSEELASGLWYGEADMKSGQRLSTTFGALHAFLPAVLALGGDLDQARRLQDSCFAMWTLHGIEPEIIDYASMTALSEGYELRPEIVESAYYLYRATGDPRYREMGKRIFDDLVRYCRVDAGYAPLASVVSKEKGNRMHSFFLAETLKYLYLLFADDALDFHAVVFNTEAHPLRDTWTRIPDDGL